MAALTKFGTVSGSRIRSDRGGRCTEHGMMTRRKWHDNLPSRDFQSSGKYDIQAIRSVHNTADHGTRRRRSSKKADFSDLQRFFR
jgi:hypothetical protein